ncbi:MAG: hypothetical protein HPY66_3239 [Firmicutes bacterium]|nr:hypothetical protein [Bacillota bacterium]
MQDSKAAAEYADIKVKLEKEFRTNRDMYRLFKSEFGDKTVNELKEKSPEQ